MPVVSSSCCKRDAITTLANESKYKTFIAMKYYHII